MLSNSEDLKERNLVDETETGLREKGCVDISSAESVWGPVVGFSVHGNDTSVSMKSEMSSQLRYCQIFNDDQNWICLLNFNDYKL